MPRSKKKLKRRRTTEVSEEPTQNISEEQTTQSTAEEQNAPERPIIESPGEQPTRSTKDILLGLGGAAVNLAGTGMEIVKTTAKRAASAVGANVVLASAAVGETKRRKLREETLAEIYPTDESLKKDVNKITKVSKEKFTELLNAYINSRMHTRSFVSNLGSATDDLKRDIESCSSPEQIAKCLRIYLKARQNHGLGFCDYLIRHMSTVQTHIEDEDHDTGHRVTSVNRMD